MNRTQNPPVRAEPVEALPRLARHFDKLSPFDRLRMHGHSLRQAPDSRKYKLSPFDRLRMHGHFDKLSADGVFVIWSH